jgi:ankyrin repeat protein
MKKQMIDCIEKGDLDGFKKLDLSSNSEKLIREDYDYLLTVAIENGKLEIIKYIVSQQGIDLKTKDNVSTFTSLASRNGQLETLKYLVLQGAKIDINTMFAASLNNFIEVVEYLKTNEDVKKIINSYDYLEYFRRSPNILNVFFQERENNLNYFLFDSSVKNKMNQKKAMDYINRIYISSSGIIKKTLLKAAIELKII